MKLIDKYILRTFLTPFLYCLLAFVLIYVIYDLFDHVKDFIEAHTPALDLARYYALLLPSVLVYIVPISLLLAILYSLSQLTRNNELTAMRASGISLYRLLIPLMGVGLFISLAVAIVNETIGPWSAWWTRQYIRQQTSKGQVDVTIANNIPYNNTKANRVWLIGRLHLDTYRMENIRLIQQDAKGHDVYQMQAREGRWLDGRWWFMDSAIQRYDQGGSPMGPPRYERRREMGELTEKPSEFMNEVKDPEYLSALELRRYIHSHSDLSPQTLARFRTDFHARLAAPWTCLVVTLIGIPFGAQTGRKGALVGIILCISLFFAYYVVSNFALVLGKSDTIPAWLAGWFANGLFLVVASVLIYRMR